MDKILIESVFVMNKHFTSKLLFSRFPRGGRRDNSASLSNEQGFASPTYRLERRDEWGIKGVAAHFKLS
jgi:hypothetical protein